MHPKKLSGTLWIDEKDREVRRMIARFDDNFHLGFGLFSVGKGSNFTFNQKLVNNELWLPTDAQGHLIAHAMGFIGYRADISLTDDQYQRFHTEAQQQPGERLLTTCAALERLRKWCSRSCCPQTDATSKERQSYTI